jgi:hypothetical protein
MGQADPAAREHFRGKVLHKNIDFVSIFELWQLGLFRIRTSGYSRCPSGPGALPSPRILRLDPARGERDQLVHGPEIELLFDTRAMGFDGLGAQMEFLRDLDGAFASAD